MTSIKTKALIPLLAFFAGCLGGPTLEALVVRPLSAQQVAAGVQRWEYQCAAIDGRTPSRGTESANAISNQLGAAGWEMSGVTGVVFCFKRPLP